MKILMRLMIIGMLVTGLGMGGCAAVAGGVVTAGAYEYTNKEALDKINKEYKEGKINKQEYEARKKDIESGSLVY